jgi:hypothetical protein
MAPRYLKPITHELRGLRPPMSAREPLADISPVRLENLAPG